jgi:uncharacterized integral membrane protein
VTVRFLFWELQSSLAIVTLAATMAGVVIAALVGSGRTTGPIGSPVYTSVVRIS